MPINETPNTVTVGKICLFCTFFATKECPYKNHNKKSITAFTGDIRGKCIFYDPIAVMANEGNKMVKQACNMDNSELNINLFKKVMSLNKTERKKLFDYWDYIYPSDYAEDMVTDDIETKQREIGNKGINPKDLKNKKNKKSTGGYGETKFPEPFKA